MTYLGLCKAYPRVELKIPDRPRGRFLSLKEAERYLYGEGYFLTLFSLVTFLTIIFIQEICSEPKY